MTLILMKELFFCDINYAKGFRDFSVIKTWCNQNCNFLLWWSNFLWDNSFWYKHENLLIWFHIWYEKILIILKRGTLIQIIWSNEYSRYREFLSFCIGSVELSESNEKILSAFTSQLTLYPLEVSSGCVTQSNQSLISVFLLQQTEQKL